MVRVRLVHADLVSPTGVGCCLLLVLCPLGGCFSPCPSLMRAWWGHSPHLFFRRGGTLARTTSRTRRTRSRALYGLHAFARRAGPLIFRRAADSAPLPLPTGVARVLQMAYLYADTPRAAGRSPCLPASARKGRTCAVSRDAPHVRRYGYSSGPWASLGISKQKRAGTFYRSGPLSHHGG